MIYAGELFFLHPSGAWSKVYAVLMSDLLLLTRVERDNYLTVLEEPLVLQDITAINWCASHGTYTWVYRLVLKSRGSVRNSCVKVTSPQGKDLEKVTCPATK
jgi:hypothetical protein